MNQPVAVLVESVRRDENEQVPGEMERAGVEEGGGKPTSDRPVTAIRYFEPMEELKNERRGRMD